MSRYTTETSLDALVGMRVDSLLVSEDERALLVTENPRNWDDEERTLVLDTDGDCCSTSWWADVYGVKQLLGHTVNAVKVLDLPDDFVEDGRTRQEYDQAYGFELMTTGGACKLVFRNSSNGYYGGWASVHQPTSMDVRDTWRPITEDWRA